MGIYGKKEAEILAENFNDYGDYMKEERYQAKSKIGKIFSFRTLKKVFRWLIVGLIIFIYVFFAYRIIESKMVFRHTDMVWTNEAYASYGALGDDFRIYTYDAESEFGIDYSKNGGSYDGRFSVYGMRYIPSVNELQFTVRYNSSTLDALREKYSLESVGAMPFRFILRDEAGNIYEKASYKYKRVGRYTYVNIVFSDIDLFDSVKKAPAESYPTATAPNAGYIYKGASKYGYEKSGISALYLNMYYSEDYDPTEESFGVHIAVYRNSYDLELFNYKKELKNAPSDGLITIGK